MIIVKDVDKNSQAWNRGLRPGDKISKINGEEAVDLLDILFVTDEIFKIKVRGKGDMEIEGDGNPGFDVEDFAVRKCANDCIFCFVSQLPPGLRESLYIKDDDYRMSFLYGSYITMTNISEKDLRRIERLRLSPLYISVHVVDENVRRDMMNCPGGGDLMIKMSRLADSNINFHTQIVVVPGVNDGLVLGETVSYLEGFYPAVESITIVPVGLTDHRKSLTKIRKLKKKEAESILELVYEKAEEENRNLGEKLIYATDEMYLTAGKRPPLEIVDELHDNGVGMYGRLMEDLKYAVEEDGIPDYSEISVAVITSIDGSRMLKPIQEELAGSVEKLDLHPVENSFFGPMVTVTGLLTGGDVLKKINDISGEYERILIPDVIFNMDGLTLDGISIETIENSDRAVTIVSTDVNGLLKGIR